MTLELWNTLASVGTFLVIAATAIAALIQLRHMRSSNQIAALNEMRETLESKDYTEAVRFAAAHLPDLLNNPNGRERLGRVPLEAELQPLATIGNFFETVGTYVKYGIIDKDVALDLWGAVIRQNWDRMEPFVALRRRTFGPRGWENFEYLAVLAKDHDQAHPDGLYPRGVRRLIADIPKG